MRPPEREGSNRTEEVQMADRIRVGIVGATVTQGGSHWGANAHVPALKALPNYELKAVCTSRGHREGLGRRVRRRAGVHPVQ